MSQSNDQMASALKRAIQQVLVRGLNDPRVRGLVSVTTVTVSEDLADATVFISVLPEEHADLTIHGLRHATAHIRTSIGKIIRVRRMPRIAFKLDHSLKRESEIIATINRVREEDAARAASKDGSSSAEDLET